jgi:hypothetical protein
MHPFRSRRTKIATQAALSLTLAITGCHSAHIDVTITNATARPVSLIQMDYPSASFGDQLLTPGKSFHYRFKVLGSGPVKLTYTDAAQKEHTSTGPSLQEGNEGPLTVIITNRGNSTGSDVQWTPGSFPPGR